MKNKDVTLKSLEGKHTLSAVFFDAVGAVQVCRFTLDKKHYEAVEGDNDGYRSSLDRISVTDIKPKKQIKPVKVIGVMHPQSATEEIIQFLNPKTKKPILEIGTANCDDYYPSFVAEFHQENI